MTIQAKIIADSLSPEGVRLTTLQLKYPRFIHSEMMTHRMFSRNASSSRAIPVDKMLKEIEDNPAAPVHWGKNQAGMQASSTITPLNETYAREEWEAQVKNAVRASTYLSYECEVHKQVANRLTEPFQHINVICTATEWDNFFALRDHPAAQPEIRQLAQAMRRAMDESEPEELKAGQWHLPYVTGKQFVHDFKGSTEYRLKLAVKCSVARCARVSYLNHDKSEPDIKKDIALADKLISMGHMSPCEHQATPMQFPSLTETDLFNEIGSTHVDRQGNFWSGNFRGWNQYRQTL